MYDVYVYVYIYACLYACRLMVHACMTHVCTFVRMHACIICVCMFVSVCMYVCIHVCAFVCMYVRTYVCRHGVVAKDAKDEDPASESDDGQSKETAGTTSSKLFRY